MGAMCAKEVFELLDATREDDLERIKELLANGVDINQKDDVSMVHLLPLQGSSTLAKLH